MMTGRQVDYLYWAVAEARRLRAEEQERRREPELLPRDAQGFLDGFVTEWQSSEGAVLPL